MSQPSNRSQIKCLAVRTIHGTFVAGAVLLTALTLIAQERSKAETDAIALARKTLAATLSIPLDQLSTISVSPAQWRDSSLGCPERGKTYLPVLTSGYEVKLRETGREHVVHVAGARAVTCGSQPDAKQPPASMIAGSLKAAEAVRSAVAMRLGIDPARVRILSTRPFRSTTPCPAAPAAATGAALVVEAEAGSQTFRYYTDDTQVSSCEK